MRVLLNVPRQVRRGDPIEIRILISHPMESGQRRNEMGDLVPRMIINDLRCTYAGQTVLQLDLFPAIAANPYLAFAARAETSGPLVITWSDDSGATQTETVQIEVV